MAVAASRLASKLASAEVMQHMQVGSLLSTQFSFPHAENNAPAAAKRKAAEKQAELSCSVRSPAEPDSGQASLAMDWSIKTAARFTTASAVASCMDALTATGAQGRLCLTAPRVKCLY